MLNLFMGTFKGLPEKKTHRITPHRKYNITYSGNKIE